MGETKSNHTSKSIFKNVLYGFATWIFPLGLSFAATPIIIRALGDKDYGIYALVLGFIAYSFNLSFGRAITKYIAEYRAAGETEKIREVISATLFINITVGIAGLLLIVLSAKYLVVNAFQIEPENQDVSIYALYLAALTIFFLMLNQVFNSILQGIHRFDIFSKITLFNSVGVISGNIILALQGYGLLILLAWNLLITFLTCLIFIVSAKRLLPEFGISFRIKRETVKAVLKFSAGVIGYQILANLFVLFERGWITRRLGSENLTYYVVPMSLAIYIQSFSSSIVLVIFPLASELKNDRAKLLRLYTKAVKAVCFFTVFIVATLIVHSHDFLELWIHKENFADQSYQLLTLHAITFGLLAIQAVAWQMTEGLGFPQFNTLIYSICLIINVVLMVFLTQSFGNAGIAFSRTIGFSIMFLSLFYVEKWFFYQIQFKFWTKLIATLGAAIAASIIVQEIITRNFPVRWIWLIASVFGGGIVYCLTLFLLGFITAEEKLLIRSLLKRA